MFIYVDIFLLLLVYQYYQRHVYTRNTMFASFSLLANTVDALCVCFFLIACLCTYLFTSVCYFVESEEVILTNPEDTGKMSELVPLSRTNTGSLVWYKPRFPCLVQKILNSMFGHLLQCPANHSYVLPTPCLLPNQMYDSCYSSSCLVNEYATIHSCVISTTPLILLPVVSLLLQVT